MRRINPGATIRRSADFAYRAQPLTAVASKKLIEASDMVTRCSAALGGICQHLLWIGR
jgi:hypothetical protein